MFIYKITNLINGKLYIGQTTRSIEERFKQHLKPSNRCTILKEAIKKYGRENFKIELIEICKKEDLDIKEIFWIKELNTISPNGYNIVGGGNKGPIMTGNKNWMFGKKGLFHPQFGKKRSEEFKKNMSEKSSGKNNGMYGVTGKHHPSSIKIVCKNNNKIYDAIQDAARELNLDPSAIVKVLKNKNKHHKGFIFTYFEENYG